jgi:hypothetical protein
MKAVFLFAIEMKAVFLFAIEMKAVFLFATMLSPAGPALACAIDPVRRSCSGRVTCNSCFRVLQLRICVLQLLFRRVFWGLPEEGPKIFVSRKGCPGIAFAAGVYVKFSLSMSCHFVISSSVLMVFLLVFPFSCLPSFHPFSILFDFSMA